MAHIAIDNLNMSFGRPLRARPGEDCLPGGTAILECEIRGVLTLLRSAHGIVPVAAVILGVPSLWLLPDSLDSPVTLFVFPLAAGVGCAIGRAMWLWREDRRSPEI